MRKKHRPRYYIAWMAAQPAVFALLCVLGVWLDSLLWKDFYTRPRPEGTPVGHPSPIFSLALPLLGVLLCGAVFVIALVGLIRCRRRLRRAREGLAPSPEEWSYCPRCGAKLYSARFCIRCGKPLKPK